MSKVKTWLPVFSGFYNTIWDDNDDYELDEEKFTDEQKEEYYRSDLYYDNVKDYEHSVVSSFIKELTDKLKEGKFVKSIEFEKIVSPKEYNFTNDSVNVIIDINTDICMKYIVDNKESFSKYLKDHYTSCDGFWSHYSNDYDTWVNDKDLFESSHMSGAVLNFICQNEEITEIDMYEDIRSNGAYFPYPSMESFLEYMQKVS
jgi:hypothetical protein